MPCALRRSHHLQLQCLVIFNLAGLLFSLPVLVGLLIRAHVRFRKSSNHLRHVETFSHIVLASVVASLQSVRQPSGALSVFTSFLSALPLSPRKPTCLVLRTGNYSWPLTQVRVQSPSQDSNPLSLLEAKSTTFFQRKMLVSSFRI